MSYNYKHKSTWTYAQLPDTQITAALCADNSSGIEIKWNGIQSISLVCLCDEYKLRCYLQTTIRIDSQRTLFDFDGTTTTVENDSNSSKATKSRGSMSGSCTQMYYNLLYYSFGCKLWFSLFVGSECSYNMCHWTEVISNKWSQFSRIRESDRWWSFEQTHEKCFRQHTFPVA